MFIPLSEPLISGNAWAYLKECLDTNWVSSLGPFVDKFELLVRDYTGARFAISTVNGTSALHLALVAAGVQPHDEVLVSSLTFIASANAIRYCGAVPVFVDAEPKHWQMDVSLVEDFLHNHCRRHAGQVINSKTGRTVRAILPVHILGHPVDMGPLLALAQQFNLPIIEDAAESLGTEYQGQKVGSFGAAGCFSFNGNKTITCGGGGMLVTNDPEMAKKARYLSTQAKDHPEEYIHHEMGYNYRLTNMAGALGCSQMECLEDFLAKKRHIAQTYRDLTRAIPGLHFFQEAPGVRCTYWLSTFRLDRDAFSLGSREVIKKLAARGIQARPLWQPMHLSPAHQDCPALVTGVADQLFADCISLPSSVSLTPEAQHFVVSVLSKIQQGL